MKRPKEWPNPPEKQPTTEESQTKTYDSLQPINDESIRLVQACRYVDAADLTIRECNENIGRLKAAIMLVSHRERGGCWCEYGIGHPSFGNHSAACSALRELLGEL